MLSILDFAILIWIYFDDGVSSPSTHMRKVTVIPVPVERKDGRPWKTEPCDSLRGAVSVYEDVLKFS